MNLINDAELNTRVILFDSTNDLLESAQAADASCSYGYNAKAGYGTGWDGIRTKLNSEWAEGNAAMLTAAEEIRKAIIVTPVSIRRKRRWSENDGDLDIDQALRGSPELFRESYRAHRPRTQNIVVCCYITASGCVSDYDLMWRNAAAVVACDLLEESGYACEMWGYSSASGAYHGENTNRFLAVPLKGSGEPMDVDRISKTLSPWFYRSAIFSSYSCAGRPSSELGYPSTANRERCFSRHCSIDTTNSEVIFMPERVGRYAAVQAAKEILESITQPA